MPTEFNKTIFILNTMRSHGQQTWILTTPTPVDIKLVRGAWSYAIKHSPLTLEEPDYPKAIALLQKRHPSWKIDGTYGQELYRVSYDIRNADDDVPEVDIKSKDTEG